MAQPIPVEMGYSWGNIPLPWHSLCFPGLPCGSLECCALSLLESTTFSGMSALPDMPPEPSHLPAVPPRTRLVLCAVVTSVFLRRVSALAACGLIDRHRCACCGRFPDSYRAGLREIRFAELPDVLMAGSF